MSNSRLNINIPTPLLERVEEYAEKHYINKTSAICVLLATALELELSESTEQKQKEEL